jgi:hypothetical protein
MVAMVYNVARGSHQGILSGHRALVVPKKKITTLFEYCRYTGDITILRQ